VLFAVGLAAGCGGVTAIPSKDSGASTSTGGSGGGGGHAAGSGGAGGAHLTDAGAPDSVTFVPHPFVPGPYNHALVPGGASSSSPLFKLVLTAGQSPGGGNSVKTSLKYRFVGGLVGSTQK
jgi:hypothetical protein